MLVQTGHGIQVKYPLYMEIFILQGASDVKINRSAMQNLSYRTKTTPTKYISMNTATPTIATRSWPSVCIKFDRTTRMCVAMPRISTFGLLGHISWSISMNTMWHCFSDFISRISIIWPAGPHPWEHLNECSTHSLLSSGNYWYIFITIN